MPSEVALTFRIKKLDYPPLDFESVCPACGMDQVEDLHRIISVIETFRDRTIGVYFNRTCNRCGFSWGESVPVGDELAEMNKLPGIKGFGDSKDG